MLSASLAFLVVVAPALALPNFKLGNCDLSNAQISLPPNQTVLVKPAIAPSFVGIAVGVQNYTCNATSQTYSPIGAFAEIFDMSCFADSPISTTIQNDAFDIWNSAPSSITTKDVIQMLSSGHMVLGQHYFVPNPKPAVGSSPKWDFTSASERGNAQAYAIGAKVGDLLAPTSSNDVDWLQLKSTQGQLADTVYRVETKGGQPPNSCNASDALLSVKYSAQYWFYGGTVKQ